MATKKTLLQQIAEAKNNISKFLQGKNQKNVSKIIKQVGSIALKTNNPAIGAIVENRKLVQDQAAKFGKTLQKTPDTTAKITKQPKGLQMGTAKIGPVSVPVSDLGAKAVPFATGIVGEAARSYGRTIERLNTPQGRGQLVQGGKDLVTKTIPKIAKNPRDVAAYLEGLSNPTVQAGLDVTDVLPTGFATIGLKSFFKKGAREGAEKLVKEGVENAAEKGILQRLGKTKISKEFEPAVKVLKGNLSSKEVYKVDGFIDWVKRTGGRSTKPENLANPKDLEDIILMTKNVWGQKAADTWSFKKIANAWEYAFKRLSESKRGVPFGLEVEDVSKNFMKNTDNAVSNFVRKPQELNVNRLDLTDAQKAHVQSLESNEIRQRLGDEQVLKIAKDAGIDTKTYTIDETAQKIAEQLNVRRNIVSLEKELSTATDPVSKEKIIRQIAENSRISRTQGTDVARQLSARRIIANELDTPMQRIFKLLDEAGVNPEVYTKKAADVDWANPNQVVKFYRDLVPAKASDWLDAIRYNSMLSSPLTHIVNISSNLLNTGVVAPVEKTVTGAIDFFNPIRRIKGQPQSQFAGEGAAFLKGYITATKKANKAMIDALRGKSLISNLDLTRAPLATSGKKRWIANALEPPMRALEAMDQFFMTLTREAEEGALKYRKAKGGKIIGDIAQMSKENAAYRTFRAPLNNAKEGYVLRAVDTIPKSIMNWRNSKNPLVRTAARFTFPFIGTPTNIAKQGIEYSPAGFLTTFGAKNKTEQVVKAVMGTVASLGAATLLGSGRLSWAEPTDPDERNAYRAAGKQPYSVKLGDGTWVQYSKLPPVVSFNLALISALDDAQKNKKLSEGDVDAIMEAVAKYGNFLADQSYFKQMGDMLAAIKGNPESYARAFSNFPQQLIPLRALGGWLARITDPAQRKIDNDVPFWDKQVQLLMQNIPIVSQNLPARVDSEGEVVPNQNRFLNSISPARITNEIKDKLVFLAEEDNGITLYEYLKTMDKNRANAYADGLYERSPQMYSKLEKFRSIEELGLGRAEFEMVGKGIKNGERAGMIAKQLNNLPSKEEKNDYINKLYDLGIMDKDDIIYEQLGKLKEKGKLKPPTSSPVEAVAPEPVQEIPEPKSIINADTAPITQSYGNYNPEVEIFSGGTNYGTDFGVGEDTELSLPEGVWEVIDAYDGEDMNSGYGKSVLVENRKTGERIRLSHLNRVLADKGELLKGGSTIGFSGNTGNSTGPHVDVEYYDQNGNIGDILRSKYAKNL